jgi:hypothetical protein
MYTTDGEAGAGAASCLCCRPTLRSPDRRITSELSRRVMLAGAASVVAGLGFAPRANAQAARAAPPGPDPEPEPPPADEGAARWLAPLEATISSADTGPIVALTAWGGEEFGYSYRYSLEEAPAGVAIDEDTGVLSLGEMPGVIGVGDHSFLVHVTNRQGGQTAAFTFVFHVLEAGKDILHKTYKPEDFGGNLTNMQSRILSDQEAAGDGLLRARIEFKRGKTYTYADNHWLTGVQFYECVAVGSGAAPKLQNTLTTASHVYDQGPLRIGVGANCFTEKDNGPDKNRMALIADAQVGDDHVTLLNVSDGGRLRPGMWHAVCSYCQQMEGYPPNIRWIDYVKVLSVDGVQVTLDRPLNHAHKADYWEDPNDGKSFGKARIGPWELGDGKTRCTERGVWTGIEFLISPTYTVTYVESHIHLFMTDCKIPYFVPSMNKHAILRNCTVTEVSPVSATRRGEAAELDKLHEMVVLDGCTIIGYVTGATGITYLLTRNCSLYPVSVSARQARDIGSTVDAHGDTHMCVPWQSNFIGPCLEREFDGTQFAANGAHPYWSWTSDPVDPLPLSSASWQGNKLIIRRDFQFFQSWLVWLWEGCMLFTGPKVDNPQSYGRVDKLYAPPDGSALWADVTWIKGTKPTSGNLNIPQKGLRKVTWLPGTEITAGSWADPSYICMEGTPGDRPFPEGIS